MSRTKFLAFMLLCLVAVALWAWIGWESFSTKWQAPLGPRLSLASQPPSMAGNTAIPSQPPSQPVFGTVTRNTPKIAPVPLCGGPTTMTILAIGSDTRSGNYLYGLADVIRYIRVDFVTPRVNVLEFPRDLWVEIPGIEKHYGITHGKLNQAYFYGNPGMGYYNGPDQGPGLLASTLDMNFGARPDHYIAANMQTFVQLVDNIGGIDVYLPYSVDARQPDQIKRLDLYFPAGEHHLNGEEALMLGRIRQFSVFERADQQNRIICALREAMLNPYNLPKLPGIIDTFNGAVQTDLSPQQLGQLACLIPSLGPGSITFTTFPRNLLTEARTYDIGVGKDVYIFKADFDTLRLLVQGFDTGLWPGPKPTPDPSATRVPPGEGSFQCP